VRHENAENNLSDSESLPKQPLDMSWSRVLSNGNVTRSTLWKSRKIERNVSAVFCVCAASQLYMYSRSEPPPCFTWTAPVQPNSDHHMIMHTAWHTYNYKYTALPYLTFRVSSAHLQCYWNLNEAIVNWKMLPPQPFHGPFSGTTWVSQCQKRTSGLYGARGD